MCTNWEGKGHTACTLQHNGMISRVCMYVCTDRQSGVKCPPIISCTQHGCLETTPTHVSQGLLARSTQAQAGQLLGAVGEQLRSAQEAAKAAKAQRAALRASCQALEEEIARWGEAQDGGEGFSGLDVQPQLDAIVAQAQRGASFLLVRLEAAHVSQAR